jgi:hypothetical protein
MTEDQWNVIVGTIVMVGLGCLSVYIGYSRVLTALKTGKIKSVLGRGSGSSGRTPIYDRKTEPTWFAITFAVNSFVGLGLFYGFVRMLISLFREL